MYCHYLKSLILPSMSAMVYPSTCFLLYLKWSRVYVVLFILVTAAKCRLFFVFCVLLLFWTLDGRSCFLCSSSTLVAGHRAVDGRRCLTSTMDNGRQASSDRCIVPWPPLDMFSSGGSCFLCSPSSSDVGHRPLVMYL